MSSYRVIYDKETGYMEEDEEFELIRKLVINTAKMAVMTARTVLSEGDYRNQMEIQAQVSELLSDIDELEKEDGEVVEAPATDQ